MDSIKNAANTATEKAKDATGIASENTQETVAGQKQGLHQETATDSSAPIGKRLGAAGGAVEEAGNKYAHKAEGEAHKQNFES